MDSQTEFAFAMKHLFFFLFFCSCLESLSVVAPIQPGLQKVKRKNAHFRGGNTIQVFPQCQVAAHAFLSSLNSRCFVLAQIKYICSDLGKNGVFSSIPFCVCYFIANMISSFLLNVALGLVSSAHTNFSVFCWAFQWALREEVGAGVHIATLLEFHWLTL